jgi:dTDP-4-amino-4,6-dideoxygalactose transaminase
MSAYRIPFNKPRLAGNELRYVEEALERGHLSADGIFTLRCAELLEASLGVEKVLLTTSCTHALEMCATLLDLKPGDEVIVPSFAFVTTASAFALRGARLVFADVRADTFNLDETALEALVTPRTKAIVPLHYAGVGCEMDAILEIARDAGVSVVEDNAHGLFGSYRNRPLGSFGRLATQSFHETKNFTCGEGGALVVNDPELVERAEILRHKGTDRGRFLRGEVDRYTWVDLGSSYAPSEILAAFLFAQLEARERIQAERARRWRRYRAALHGWAEEHGVHLPNVPDHCRQPHHMFHLLLPAQSERNALIDHLRERGIIAVFHFQPLHRSVMGWRSGGHAAKCPVAESVSGRLVRLPFYNGMSDADQNEVVAAVQSFQGFRARP